MLPVYLLGAIMKQRPANPVLSQELAKKLIYNCMICSKAVEGFYSQHEGGGTCSRKCMTVQDSKPKFPGHSAEDFEKLHNL